MIATTVLECSNRRLIAAACASVLLHGLLLASYERASVEGAIPIETPSQRLNATLRIPLPPRVAPAQSTAEEGQTKFERPLHQVTPGKHIEAAEKSTTATAQTVLPTPSAQAGDNASRVDSVPRVNLEAAYQSARQMARGQSRYSAPAARHQPALSLERETALGRAIARSARADCRTAYAGAGLFAIPALILDAATDNGCKW